MTRRRPILGSLAAAAVLVLTVGATALAGGVTGTAAAAGVAAAAATPGCGKAPTLTSGQRSIQSSGQSRSFILRIPDNYDRNHQYRLIFGFHWNGGTANDVDGGGADGAAWSYYGLRQQANNSTIFVAPQGNGNGWANPSGRDVTFVDDMVRLIENDLCVDTTQLFALGFSYGGGMSYSLACSRANVFRAVAVYSGGQLSGCSGGGQPIAYMGIHGIGDPVLNVSAGRSLRDTFVRNNGCTAQNPPEPRAGSLTHITTTYSGCRSGYPVVWAAFDGGHTPGPVDGGGDSGARTWTKGEVWRFFTQFGSTSPTPTPTPTTSPTGEPTTPPPSGTGAVRHTSSGRCLDVNGGAQTNGAAAIIWDCHGQSNQSWTSTAAQELRVFGGKCLDVNGGATANGSSVIIWDCNGQANQRWRLNADGTITAVGSGRCLEVVGNGTANGARTQIWDCNGGAGQRWSRS
ncbi:ricin-type beta-trefoil lectin domain protein [Micromonospora sp. WMMD987]|uniref:ricin-type beta-trefoil lectin domain protein n=1 Tax=Micromonospora sp. WMMD987 TaxID=3016089 RepID=UPI00249B233E|nr:ricin-type beta-trefoil lectin domain protein [Micromonospora sp. WMMD987]WFE96701.1 ricin-type beta-trefoil lectin domain protein [Micromonospora sp. WMMD987]